MIISIYGTKQQYQKRIGAVMKKVELSTCLINEKAYQIYNNSSFVFYQDSKGFYMADSQGITPTFIGENLGDVENCLLFYADDNEEVQPR